MGGEIIPLKLLVLLDFGPARTSSSGTQITSIPRTKHQRVAHFSHVSADHGTQFAAENNTILRRRARIDLSRKLDCNLL